MQPPVTARPGMAPPTPEQMERANAAVKQIMMQGQDKFAALKPYSDRVGFISRDLDRVHETLRMCIQHPNRISEQVHNYLSAELVSLEECSAEAFADFGTQLCRITGADQKACSESVVQPELKL